MQIGDTFIIIHSRYSRRGRYSCKDPNKKFTIGDISKSGLSVYYEDNRTNNKCRCNYCRYQSSIKCISISNLEIVETKLQKQRNEKLKFIL